MTVLKRSFLLLFLVLSGTCAALAQGKPKVYISDDFYLESGTPAYLWFYDQKGVLEKLRGVDDSETVGLVGGFAKNCECTVVRDPGDADYVVMVSRYDLVFRPKLAEKKFIVIKVDGERLITKGSVRRISNVISDACKAMLKDWQKPSS